MNKKTKCCNDNLNETGSSNWLTVIPVCEFNYLNFGNPPNCDTIGDLLQVYQLAVRVETGFNIQHHVMQEGRIRYFATQRNERYKSYTLTRCRIRAIPFDIKWRRTNDEENS